MLRLQKFGYELNWLNCKKDVDVLTPIPYLDLRGFTDDQVKIRSLELAQIKTTDIFIKGEIWNKGVYRGKREYHYKEL